MEREQNCFKTDGTNTKSLKPYNKGNKTGIKLPMIKVYCRLHTYKISIK